MLGDYIIGKYLRLSIDEAQTGSVSIENQRMIIDRHIKDMDVHNATILEFVDNGHSGTNFERPAMQELLGLVRNGKINCILVKDMSRFGRDLIENSYYLERIFPLYRTRFISVCDCFDSAEYEGGTGGIDIALKSLVHEQYSRDLSDKIKLAKRTKMLRGESVRKNCLFGYMLNDDRQMVIDNPAAETVRLIFKLAHEGKSITDIGAQLYKEKRPTPSNYKEMKNNTGYIWTPSHIRSMLKEEQYAGTYVAGRTKQTVIGSKSSIKVPESEWVKIPDHHPAIISRDIFNEVQEIVAKKAPKRNRDISTQQRYGSAENPLKGKVVCGCCAHHMSMSHDKNPRFSCGFTLVAPDAECYKLSIIGHELEVAVLQAFHSNAHDALNHLSSLSTHVDCNSDYSEKLASIEDAKCTLYEKLVLSEISNDDYTTEKSKLDAEHERTKQMKGIYAKGEASSADNESIRQIVKDTKKLKGLSQQSADALIDKVYVYPGKRIEVAWKLAGLKHFDLECTADRA